MNSFYSDVTARDNVDTPDGILYLAKAKVFPTKTTLSGVKICPSPCQDKFVECRKFLGLVDRASSVYVFSAERHTMYLSPPPSNFFK